MQLPQPVYTPTPDATAAGKRSVVASPATVDDAGRLSVWFPPRDAAGGYLVRRIVVQGPAGSVARVYVGDPSPLNLADATAAGWSDVADYAQPLVVGAGRPLVVVWETSAGDPATGAAAARIELEDI